MNKYYTPNIEEFHIGFEYEVEDFNKGDDNPNDIHGKYWIKQIISKIGNRKDLHIDHSTLGSIEAMYDIYISTFCISNSPFAA